MANVSGVALGMIETRGLVPAIEAAKRDLGWRPRTDMDTAIRRTIDFYVKLGSFNALNASASGL